MKMPSPSSQSTLLLPQDASGLDTATLELLSAWRAQDATTDPDEIRAAEEEIAAFKKEMNENRAASGEPALFP